jgi:hypothetical protein
MRPPYACGIKYLQKNRKYGAVPKIAKTAMTSSYFVEHVALPGSIITTKTHAKRNSALAGAPLCGVKYSKCHLH